MIYLVTYLVGWFVGLLIFKYDGSLTLVKALTLGHLVFTVGFFGLFNFVGHVIFREKVAAQIGWESNGISGILCYWIRDGFWIATTIPFSIFLIGAGILHIIEIIKNKNFNIGNTWIIIPDFLMPITIFVLLILG
jgi:hypothetical protein